MPSLLGVPCLTGQLIISQLRNPVSRYTFGRQINFDVFKMVALSIFERIPDKSEGLFKNCKYFLCKKAQLPTEVSVRLFCSSEARREDSNYVVNAEGRAGVRVGRANSDFYYL